MSIGEKTEISTLGPIPNNFTVKNKVAQIAILQKADAFITHCGMNSVNESLFYRVPMVLFPLHSEQGVVAHRVEELGAGIKLKGNKQKNILKAVAELLMDPTYQENAKKLSDNYRQTVGAVAAANVILDKIEKNF